MANFEAVTVLWHPSSSATARAEAFLDALGAHEHIKIVHIKQPQQTLEIVQQLASSPGLIVAAGGDGTVRKTVAAFMQAREQGLKIEAILGVLPLGTGNDLARSLLVPFEASEAVEVLLTGDTIPLDVLEIQSSKGRDWCANMVTGGNTGKYLESMTDELKARWGAFCYVRGIVGVIQNLEAFEVELGCEDRAPETFSALNIFLANGRTSGGGMVVSPDASLSDGLVDVILVRDGQPGEIARLTASYFLTDYQSHDLIEFRRANKIRVTSTPAMVLTADGDTIGTTPLEIRVHSQALRVRVPQ